MVRLPDMDIIVFQQFDSGRKKTEGVQRYGKHIHIKQIVSIDEVFPEVIDYPEDYLDDCFDCDLVLNYLKHPDLASCLVEICQRKGIPVVTAGKAGKGFTPYTCCGLGKSRLLGEYGKQFGFPEYEVTHHDGKITSIKVIRGAPCAATWDALQGAVGMSLDDARVKIPLQVQQYCVADPAGWDPISGKSPVHFAAYVHLAALKKAFLADKE